MTINPQRANPPVEKRMSVKEYFTLDALFPNEKYEYHDGIARLRSAGSGEHATIAGNIYIGLRLQFRSGPCTVYNSDMRVQVTENTYYFPDVSVTCNVADRQRGVKTVQSLRLVVEVFSPSTEKTDRTEKLLTYQAYPTIAEIALVSQFAPYVEIWRRDEENETVWHYAHYGPGEEVEFASLDVRIPMEDIYREIDFSSPLVEE